MGLNFIHFSDTHLGFSDLDIFDGNNRNVREEDVYSSFRQVIDYALENKPDFVIHSGDIFHRSSPNNRPIVIAYEQIKRLAEAGIPFYMIAGNHDYPKSALTSPIHSLFGINGGIKVAYSEQYETFETEEYIIHALPHINSQAQFEEELEKIKIKEKSKANLLVLHLSVGSFLMDEYGERALPEKYKKKLKEFDYVALGHWHKFNHLDKYGNVYYSGSTERTSENEADSEKGFIHARLDEKLNVEFIPLKTRPIRRIEVNDCHKKEKAEIIREIEKAVKEKEIEGSIVSVYLKDLSPSQVYEITKSEIADLLEGSLHFSVAKKVYMSEEKIVYESDQFDLREALAEGLGTSFTDKKEYSKVKELTFRLLDEIEEEESNAD